MEFSNQLAMLVVGVLVAWLLYTFVFKAKASEKEQEAATAAAAGLAPLGAPEPQRGLPDDPLEYAKLMQPRIAAVLSAWGSVSVYGSQWSPPTTRTSGPLSRSAMRIAGLLVR